MELIFHSIVLAGQRGEIEVSFLRTSLIKKVQFRENEKKRMLWEKKSFDAALRESYEHPILNSLKVWMNYLSQGI